MSRAIQALALALLLSVPAFAGEMQCGVAPTPAPTPSAMSAGQGALPAHVVAGEVDSLTETALSVIESVLALLY